MAQAERRAPGSTRPVTVYDSDRYQVDSEGNGAFYTITRKGDEKSVFFQGDDAIHFQNRVFFDVVGLDFDEADALLSQYDEVMS